MDKDIKSTQFKLYLLQYVEILLLISNSKDARYYVCIHVIYYSLYISY